MPREMHTVFMAVHFHALGHAVLLVRVIRIAPGITRPHIPFGLTLGDPFGQNFTRTAALCNTKGEHAGLKRIGNARHRADQGHAVGRIGDRSINHLVDACGAQQRHPRHRIFNVPFKPLQIVGVKLKAEIFGQRVGWVYPMRFAVAFVRTKVQPMLFLPQIIAAIDIAQQGQFTTVLSAPRL